MLFFFVFFINTPVYAASVCPAGQHWVEPHFRKAYIRADGSEVSAANVEGHCRKNQGKRKELKNAFVNGVPAGWPHKSEKPKKWKKFEIEQVLDAIDELPKGIWTDSLKMIYRFEKSKIKGNPATSARNILVLYDLAFDSKSKHPLARVIAHELAHEIYRDMGYLEQLEYAENSGWEVDKKSLLRGELIFNSYWPDRDRIHEDGNISIDESFGNLFEAYLFDEAGLKAKKPALHNWFKKRYGDKLKKEKP